MDWFSLFFLNVFGVWGAANNCYGLDADLGLRCEPGRCWIIGLSRIKHWYCIDFGTNGCCGSEQLFSVLTAVCSSGIFCRLIASNFRSILGIYPQLYRLSLGYISKPDSHGNQGNVIHVHPINVMDWINWKNTDQHTNNSLISNV